MRRGLTWPPSHFSTYDYYSPTLVEYFAKPMDAIPQLVVAVRAAARPPTCRVL